MATSQSEKPPSLPPRGRSRPCLVSSSDETSSESTVWEDASVASSDTTFNDEITFSGSFKRKVVPTIDEVLQLLGRWSVEELPLTSSSLYEDKPRGRSPIPFESPGRIRHSHSQTSSVSSSSTVSEIISMYYYPLLDDSSEALALREAPRSKKSPVTLHRVDNATRYRKEKPYKSRSRHFRHSKRAHRATSQKGRRLSETIRSEGHRRRHHARGPPMSARLELRRKRASSPPTPVQSFKEGLRVLVPFLDAEDRPQQRTQYSPIPSSARSTSLPSEDAHRCDEEPGAPIHQQHDQTESLSVNAGHNRSYKKGSKSDGDVDQASSVGDDLGEASRMPRGRPIGAAREMKKMLGECGIEDWRKWGDIVQDWIVDPQTEPRDLSMRGWSSDEWRYYKEPVSEKNSVSDVLPIQTYEPHRDMIDHIDLQTNSTITNKPFKHHRIDPKHIIRRSRVNKILMDRGREPLFDLEKHPTKLRKRI